MKRRWRKSSRSGSGSVCVELCVDDTNLHIRDSKLPDNATHMSLARSELAALSQFVRNR